MQECVRARAYVRAGEVPTQVRVYVCVCVHAGARIRFGCAKQRSEPRRSACFPAFSRTRTNMHARRLAKGVRALCISFATPRAFRSTGPLGAVQWPSKEWDSPDRCETKQNWATVLGLRLCAFLLGLPFVSVSMPCPITLWKWGSTKGVAVHDVTGLLFESGV